MTDRMLAIIDKAFPLAEQDCGEYKKMKVSGMGFTIRRFRAEGLGSVSVMVASGFFGLMKMDTLIITPTEKDMPLFSYDRVHAMGNDTLIFELYDTLLNSADLSALEEVKKQAAHLPDHDLGKHWYDSYDGRRRDRLDQTEDAAPVPVCFFDVPVLRIRGCLPGTDVLYQHVRRTVDGTIPVLLRHGQIQDAITKNCRSENSGSFLHFCGK